MLYTMKPILDKAREDHYAVAAPNVLDYKTIDVAIKTAEKKNAPIILNVTFETNDDLSTFVNYAKDKAIHSKVPVAINLDHGGDYEQIIKSLKMDFTSIMVDRSMLEFEDNIKEVSEIVKIAHTLGCSVEAELGHVGTNIGADSEGMLGRNTIITEEDKKATFTKVEEAVEYVERTKVDCLAVAIGTVHGLYPKGLKPSIDFELLKKIREAVNVPLVIHGGSGSGDDNLARACKEGICKVNICSDLLKKGREYINNGYLKDSDDMLTKLMYPLPAYYAGYSDMLEYYIDLFKSTNKA